jgi:aconitate hydratase
VATSVLSGNRNFEGRISPDVRANYLASPPLVVAYALAGTMDINLATDPITQTPDGKDVYLKDIWPSQQEIAELVEKTVTREAFQSKYADVFKGDEKWRGVETTDSLTYDWPGTSTYVQNPPYFQGITMETGKITDIEGAKVLAILGDMVTTDHISPAGAIKHDGPAGDYLKANGVPKAEFNSFGSRRGNHEVMMRGTFANIRIKNQMAPGTEGGVTKYIPTGEVMSIFDAAEKYKADKKDLVVFAGTLYGNGSSRDWAAKGTILLGVKAVIAGSFERIHRSNLIGMGVLPLEFQEGDSWEKLGMTGSETVTIEGIENLTPRGTLDVKIDFADGSTKTVTANVRIDTDNEHEYFKNGGILHYVLRNLATAA